MEISVNVEINLSSETKDFILSVIGSKVSAPAAQPTSAPAKPAPAPAAQPVQAKPAVAPAAPAAPAQPASNAIHVEPQAAATTINIEVVRQALAAKVNSHREEIKAKLNELGSPSVTKLDPAKYEEMYSFLNSLS